MKRLLRTPRSNYSDQQERDTNQYDLHIVKYLREIRARSNTNITFFNKAAGKSNRIKYRDDEAPVVARFLDDIRQKYVFGQQYMLEKGLKKFGEKGVKSTEK